MVYREFSTEKTNYYLCYNIHQTVQEDDIFSKGKINSLDAIVLEMSNHADEELRMWKGGKWPLPYGYIKDQIIKYNPTLPVYFVDADHQSFLNLDSAIPFIVYFLSSITGYDEIFKVGLALWASKFLLFAFSSVGAALGDTKLCPQIVSKIGLFPPSQNIELRNAISAEKIEKAIVPIFDHKPKIAIVYGAGHAGIEDNLKYKKRRERIINFFKKLGFFGMEKSTLDVLTKATYDDKVGIWKISRFNAKTI